MNKGWLVPGTGLSSSSSSPLLPLFSPISPSLQTSPLANYTAAAADGGVLHGPGLLGRPWGSWSPSPPLRWVLYCHWLSERGQWALAACCRIIEAGLFDYLSDYLAGAEGPAGVSGRQTGSSVACARVLE